MLARHWLVMGLVGVGAFGLGVIQGRSNANESDCGLCVTAAEAAQVVGPGVSLVGSDAASPPVITSGGGGDEALVQVLEHEQYVLDVEASHAGGESEGGGLWYRLGMGGDGLGFSIDRDSGVLMFREAPEAESPTDVAGGEAGDSRYLLWVIVTDSIGLSDTQAILVEVVDVPEPPVFRTAGGRDYARIRVEEGHRQVTTVLAEDPESDSELPLLLPDSLSYSVVADRCQEGDWQVWCDDSWLFEIDSQSGVLRFVEPPDYGIPRDKESDNVYHVTLRVEDSTGLADTQILEIEVTDAAVPPVFTLPSSRAWAVLTVAEGETRVTDLEASDWEGETEGRGLVYEISGGPDAGLLKVDEESGRVAFVALPNFESPEDQDRDNVYVVTVWVSDSSGAFDRLVLAVAVTDVESRPEISSDGGAAIAVVAVPEGQIAVTTVFAEDEDPAELTYSIGGGADAALFTVHPSTGEVRFFDPPDFEAPADANGDNTYMVVVTVTDADGLGDSQELWIEVSDTEDA